MKKDIYFDQVFASFRYKPPIIQFIQGLKFSNKLIYGRAITQLMLQDCQHKWPLIDPAPDLIIPVPLHLSRMKERGFNQAAELAKPIAKALKLPLDMHSISRNRATQAQAQQSSAKRQTNLHNAFSCKRHFDNLHLLIVDDVMTTGHTVNELAKTAKQAGAKKITILCAARTGS